LLADLYYYGHDHKRDPEEAATWLRRVVDQTADIGITGDDGAVGGGTGAGEPTAPDVGDAYVRAKALQKLGILIWRGEAGEEGGKHTHPLQAARSLFEESIGLCQQHLSGGWAFLLSHDPPGLWENLAEEAKILKDGESLVRGRVREKREKRKKRKKRKRREREEMETGTLCLCGFC
jgi:hypothetical protein